MNSKASFTTYVINLERSTERLERAAAELHREGIPFARIAAADGAALPVQRPNYASLVDDRQFERDLTLGEIGCAMSHLNALGAFLDTPDDFCLILEDDVVVAPGARNAIESFIDWVYATNLAFHAANLGSAAKAPFSPLIRISDRTFGRSHYYPMTAAAVLWSRHGAEDFLRTNPKITAPIDVQFRHWIAARGRGLGVRPQLFHQSGHGSDIGQRKHQNQRGAMSYRYRSYARKFKERVNSISSLLRHGNALSLKPDMIKARIRP